MSASLANTFGVQNDGGFLRAPVYFLVSILASSYALLAQQPASSLHPVIFIESGFPAIESPGVSAATLKAAIPDATFADVEQLRSGALNTASLLVLPYGSALPLADWASIQRYLGGGGNLLVIGGRPFHVPVAGEKAGEFVAELPQDSYSREIGLLHSYAIPLDRRPVRFNWRHGYDFLSKVDPQIQHIYAEEGRLNGLGYLDGDDGTHLASPIIFSDHVTGAMKGARIVALPFEASPSYWGSTDGVRLLRVAADYAEAGATNLSIELQYAALRPGELPDIKIHLQVAKPDVVKGTVRVTLLQGEHVVKSADLPLDSQDAFVPFPIDHPLPPGIYTVRALWGQADKRSQRVQEFAENGFVVEELNALEQCPVLGTHGDFLSLDHQPFFPVGVNYFSTDANGWDFSGPRNEATWERDFADMERHGMNFVRTGVWMSNAKFVEPITGEANERFLRNLEGFLSAAYRHHIAVNFTCFAFVPRAGPERRPSSDPGAEPPPNPYLDSATVEQEHEYVASVVRRFRNVPWLSYDLINEPSFSNPRNIFHGNVPNGDPTEVAAWHSWLRSQYSSLSALSRAWRVASSELSSFDSIPLPKTADLTFNRYGNQLEVRALDYNLFAQEMFSDWVRGLVSTIRRTGSEQLINVGQDEGGVTNRVLNQFYATAGVSFTTNHTYWQDDALLWDSVVAKRPGLPNITGETGYQPAWDADGAWRYDELTGSAIEERKLALGFAAGSSGAMQWDWDREIDFGMLRSDGSAKAWEGIMHDLGAFAKKAAPSATGIELPDIALILPQSLQMSVANAQALSAQQMAVRVLYQRERVEAYAVGEYQTDTLGTPKLIILPSAFGLSEKAWGDILARVRDGAVLLASGPFGGDEHLHQTDRMSRVGLSDDVTPLLLRDDSLELPSGRVSLVYEGLKTTLLDQGAMKDGKCWVEVSVGKGKILYSVFPLELNSNEDAVASAYARAIQIAGIKRTYTTDEKEPGILICPTKLPHATLYVLTSETATQSVQFTDLRSRKIISGSLEAGQAALLLIGEKGETIANYHWNP